MRKRTLALLIVCLTVVGTIFVQIKLQDVKYRVHQHKEAADWEPEGTNDCISATDAAKYQYDPSAVDVEELSTHLPLVIIDTDEEIPGVPYYEEGGYHRMYTTTMLGENDLLANMRVIDHQDTVNKVDDAPDITTSIRIRVRGNTSRWFDKKSYAVKTVKQNGDSKNISVMGMESNNEWALHGPFLDKTLMRNYMAMNISGELMDYAPDVRFCEVVLNGEYQGVYVMMETISRGDGRIEVEKPNNTKNVTGYIVEIDNNTSIPSTYVNSFTKYTQILRKNSFFDIVYPGASLLTSELKDFIERDMSSFEKALYSFDYDTAGYGFMRRVDVNEFVDYFILMEVFLQHDTGNLSTYFYKSVEGLYKPCVWDFNNDLENISTIGEDDFYIRKFVTVQAPWFTMMLKEEDFTDQIILRYRQLRKGILSDEYLRQYIDDTVDFLGPAVDRNFAVWGYSFDPSNLDLRNKLHPDERNPHSYEEAMSQMEDELFSRLEWLDEHIEILKQYSHESAVKKYNH